MNLETYNSDALIGALFELNLGDLTEAQVKALLSTELVAQQPIIKVTGDLPPLEDDQDDIDLNEPEIPEILPILPLRGVVVYPFTAVPLTIGQPRSVKLIDDITSDKRMIGLIASTDPELETPMPDDMYEIGTVANIHRLFRAPDNTIRLLVQGVARCKAVDYVQMEPYLKAKIELIPELEDDDDAEVEALRRTIDEKFTRLSELTPSIPEELISATRNIEDAVQLVYAIATYIRIELDVAQDLLEKDSTIDKMHALLNVLSKELEVLELGRKIQADAQSSMEQMQREYYLREQMKAIQRELGEDDDQSVEVEEFREKIASAGMPEEAQKEAERELKRMERIQPSSAEYGVIRTYLDIMTDLPWGSVTDDILDVSYARDVLEEDHHALEDIKERILEFLAVRKLRKERAEAFAKEEATDYIRRDREGVILCFVGPPGVGKTSLGKSIARAMGRKFVRLSLGGVRDESEIRGHRRTYIGAMPGRIVQSLRRVKSSNPVFMLDEIDKMGSDFRGDPASAMLEVLDPEQNTEFRDHYLDVEYDLSQVFFVATANDISKVPGPLRDRMEILNLSGYTEKEKIEISHQYLVPRQTRENGLRPAELAYSEDAIRDIIRYYTREAGVRNLERQIGAVARKVVTGIAENKFTEKTIQVADVREYLGKQRYYYTEEVEERTASAGVCTGLAWTSVGGDVLFIEATDMPGKGGFKLTGQIGDVMQESAQAALSYIRSQSQALELPEDYFTTHDIHVHIPAGAVPKDGPSAGVTMATSLASLISGQPVSAEVGMTGEITLRGQVLPVGGIKEKVLAGHRAGLKTLILPYRNEADLEDVPKEIRDDIRFVFAKHVTEVFDVALHGK